MKTPVPFDASGIPTLLREQKRWAPWKAVWNDDRQKFDKIPLDPRDVGRGLSTAKCGSWAALGEVEAAFAAYPEVVEGAGYLMTGVHGIVGYDLDRCVDDRGALLPWAGAVLAELCSYVEWSPSGQGLRVFCRGEVDRDWTNHEVGIECYGGHAPRYLTVTGQALWDYPSEVREVPREVHERLMARYARVNGTVVDGGVGEPMPDLLAEGEVPDWRTLTGISEASLALLADGDAGEDRSRTLHRLGVELYSAGLTDAEVLSVMAGSDGVMAVALDHRRQNWDRALDYLWREHCLKARGKRRVGVDAFEDLAPDDEAAPRFERDKHGAILATLGNVVKALSCAAWCGLRTRWDTFTDTLQGCAVEGEYRAFDDNDYTQLRLTLERRGFKAVSRELVRDAVYYVAQQDTFDAAQLWLASLGEWDGEPRVDGFLAEVFGVEPGPYATAVSRYLWSAMAGRVLEPGVKADMAVILVGLQGSRKSSAIEALVPHPDHYREIDIDERNDGDNSRKLRGCLVAELAELKGLRVKEIEHVKAFLSRRHEHWIPKFKEHAARFPRRCVFVGTTNEDGFLSDPTGNRRFLPVRIERVDVEYIRTWREQLWAESRLLFGEYGVCYAEAEHLAKDQHAAFMIKEPWTDKVREWLNTEDQIGGGKPGDKDFISTLAVASDCLRIPVERQNVSAWKRIAAAMQELGWRESRRMQQGVRERGYERIG